MKKLSWIAFGLLAAVFAAIFVVAIWATLNDEEKDPPEVAARKTECKQLARHLIEITPGHAQNVDEQVAKVPIEDIEQCAAADKDKQGVDQKPAVVACMKSAQTPDAVKACVPKAAE